MNQVRFEKRVRWAREHCGLMQDERELAKVFGHVAEARPRSVLEVGSHKGGWIAVMADACQSGTVYVGIDTHDSWRRERAQVECKVAPGVKVQWITPGRIGGPGGISETFDILHIDGDHSYTFVGADFTTYSPLVRPGGLVIFHDTMSRRHRGVREFFEEIKRKLRYEGWYDWCVEYFHPPHGMGVGILRRARA